MSPCTRSWSEDLWMSVAVSTSVSLANEGLPDEARFAPPGWSELAQPFPAAPLFAHGHGTETPSPKQNELTCWPAQAQVSASTSIAVIWLLYASLDQIAVFGKKLIESHSRSSSRQPGEANTERNVPSEALTLMISPWPLWPR